MDNGLNLLQIKELVNVWIVGRQDELGSIAVKVMDTSESSLILEANGRLLQIIIPSCFQMEEYNPNALFPSDEVFLVTSLDSISDRTFESILATLNEKLERIKIQSGALGEVLDHLLLALQKIEGKNRHLSVNHTSSSSRSTSNEDINVQTEVLDTDNLSQSEDSMNGSQNEDQEEGSPDAYDDDLASSENVQRALYLQNRSNAFLYVMAEAAKLQCEIARKKSDTMHLGPTVVNDCKPYYDTLRCCNVKPDFKHSVVHLLMHIDGIVRDGSAAAALGFSLDSPVKLSLQFRKELWLQDDYSSSSQSLKPERWHVTQETGNFQKDSMADFDGVQGVRQSHLYGSEVLLPELVRIYFQFLACRTAPTVQKLESLDLLSELQQFSAMENPFIGLLCFLSARFRALPDWCVVCWNSLPYSVCRLRTCDRDFCLFRFEELGLGTPVLQEVQKFPELIDFEISVALAAAHSNRDVFEPFPAFLLENEEIRGRSGWFSKLKRFDYSATTAKTAAGLAPSQLRRSQPLTHKDKESIKSFYQNKNMVMLKQVLHSYPPLDLMRGCSDEIALKKTLTMFWHKSQNLDTQNLKGKRHNESDGGSEWTKKRWLPYDVLRFVLLTSRLTLYHLKDDEILDFAEARYQFAVLHDSPEREAHFESRRTEQGGSFFAFHGSSADNWYSILRNGLRCLSNTSYMSSGASYGTGIYLASHLSTSMNYCRSKGPGWGHGSLGDDFSVLAICEVINGSIRLDDPKSSNFGSVFLPVLPGTSTGMSRVSPIGIMVVPPEYEKDVLIRYIFVFKGPHQFCKDTHFISRTNLSNDIDVLAHYQNLRSKYPVKQREQRQAYNGARWQSMPVSPQKKRESGEYGTVDSLPAMPAHLSLSGRKKPEVEHSQNALQNCTACKSNVAPPASAMQAISKEFKNISKQINAAGQRERQTADENILAGIQLKIPDESNLCHWHVSLSPGLFRRFPLYKDLTECARQRNVSEVPVEMEFIFPPTYPFAPPFARVVSPRFTFHTGHITVGGSICMELLTVSGWSPACSFESVIVQIVNAMIEGGGRLDRTTWSSRTEYSEDEAREAFARVTRAHGWI